MGNNLIKLNGRSERDVEKKWNKKKVNNEICLAY